MKTIKVDSVKAQPPHCLMKDYEARAHIERSKLFHSYLKRINRYYRHINKSE